MSSRPIIKPNNAEPLIDAGDMSGDIEGPASVIQMTPGFSYDLAWTGTPTGTFEVQVSNTYSPNAELGVVSAGNWNALPSSSFSGTYPAPSGSPGNGFLDVVGTEAYAIRLVYTATSGAGSLTVVGCSKAL